MIKVPKKVARVAFAHYSLRETALLLALAHFSSFSSNCCFVTLAGWRTVTSCASRLASTVVFSNLDRILVTAPEQPPQVICTLNTVTHESVVFVPHEDDPDSFATPHWQLSPQLHGSHLHEFVLLVPQLQLMHVHGSQLHDDVLFSPQLQVSQLHGSHLHDAVFVAVDMVISKDSSGGKGRGYYCYFSKNAAVRILSTFIMRLLRFAECL